MEWMTLVATLLGAVIAMGSTLLIEARKDRRETTGEWRRGRRELYGAYLGTLSQVRGELALLILDRAPSDGERLVLARQIFARCYELRYQLEVFAPRAVVEPALRYFRCVRTLRDEAGGGVVDGDARCERAFVDVMDALAGVRDAMRLDMGTDSLAGL
ncbi:hypothetical protein [Streptomyces sp. AM 2-1-1]|uniref:hypothetical protein n=1 Tax=unclassified Streptomyces TaxID=2593676 RepID=UPI0023B9256D|nr:hypothetical protein [Streptomyces sp. AM 2-1-1]WEH38156.1 hypothetical protein PZB77_00770 [Streptomyces sp. AM 2-1-1]